MTFNKKESNILFKAKNALQEMFDGKLKKYHVTFYSAHEIARCYNEKVDPLNFTGHFSDTGINIYVSDGTEYSL